MPGISIRRILLVFCISIALAAAASGMSRKPTAPPPYVPGQILIKFEDNVDSSRADEIIRKEGGESKRILGHTGIYLVTLPEGTDVLKAVKRFSRYEEVQYAEPNYRATPLEGK